MTDTLLGDTQRVEIALAGSAEDFALARELIAEYAETPEVDRCIRDLEAELAGVSENYSLPGGWLWIASVGGEATGCAALRPLGDGAGEMKRLYVRPPFRGRKVGRALAETVIREAGGAGFGAVRLDTLPSMRAAADLYLSMGFREIPPYGKGSPPGAIFMEIPLNG